MSHVNYRECCFKTFPPQGLKLVWEITHKCTFGCPYCFQTRKRQQNPVRILPPEDLSTILKKLKALEIRDVLITGGEIFWAKESLSHICKGLRRLKISYSVSTDYVHHSSFIDVLISLKPRAFNVSLDPRGAELEERYDRHVKAVENVISKCQTAEIEVKATGVITRESLRNCNAYLNLLDRLSQAYPILTSIYITNPYDIGYIKTNIRSSEESLRKWLKSLSLSKTLEKVVKFINFPRFNAPLQQCMAGVKLMHLEPLGNVYPCHLLANLPKETFLMGNLVDESAGEIKKRLSDFGRRTEEAIKEYKKNETCTTKCKEMQECRGGCIAELLSIGQLVQPQLVCRHIEPPPKIKAFKPKQPLLPFRSPGEDLTPGEEEKIIEYIRQNMRKEHDIAHGFDHVQCVVKYARIIGKREGANLRIVTSAAYFHDFEPRRKLIYESHAEQSAQVAATFLKKIGFSKDELTQIYKCIITSSYGAAELGYSPETLEAKCVRDADWLDAIGARGIARVFAFGSAHQCEELGVVEWSLDPPEKRMMSLIGPDPSPIYHFFSKLLWVKDGMATETGRQMATIRHERMLKFLRDYKSEMEIEEEGKNGLPPRANPEE